jgi:hypothetical protein
MMHLSQVHAKHQLSHAFFLEEILRVEALKQTPCLTSFASSTFHGNSSFLDGDNPHLAKALLSHDEAMHRYCLMDKVLGGQPK